jgi:alpha-glucosidase
MHPTSWWRSAAIYQIYVRSFADADGDGVGDLAGARSRLPYVAELGVDAVWLTPFYVSPMADGGYDVADYRDVDPLFGSLADFDAFLADAHRLGLKVIVDVVPNHTSDLHPWFVAAIEEGAGSRARERYLFRAGRGAGGEEPPNDWESVFGGPAWTRVKEPDGQPGEWYLHLFAPEQPDLNWQDPEVHAEFADILRFWLDRGVDGFRVDVAHGMVKEPSLADIGRGGQAKLLGKEPLPYFDQDGVHEIYRAWRTILDSYPGERIAVAEAWVHADRLARYVRPDELHQAFNFHFLDAEWSCEGWRRVIDASIAGVAAVGAPPTWVLSNHDVQRHVTRYGGGSVGLRRARAAALMMLALPGSAYIYQGEELGLPEVSDLPADVLQDPIWLRSGGAERGRDGCRVPLPWSGSSPPFGFGPPGGHAPWLPAPTSWAELTVARQEADPLSMLALYRSALRLRRSLPALGDGTLRWFDSPPGTLVFARDPGFVCAVNLGAAPASLDVPGELACSSGPVERAAGWVLPGETAAWWC